MVSEAPFSASPVQNAMAQALTLKPSVGSGIDAVHMVKDILPTPTAGQLLVKMLAAPINPLDLAVVQSRYPVKPQNKAHGEPIPGYDGAAVVIECGPDVNDLHVGDKIIVKRHGLGTWRTHAVLNAIDTLQVPQETEASTAAILRMGMLVAYLLLQENSAHLRPGDWIALNAATGVVAHFVIQFAHQKGFKVVSIIRDRPDSTNVKRTLQRHGSDLVLEEKEVANKDHFRDKRLMLGLDAVFGINGQALLRLLSPGATYVTYGFLSGVNTGTSISVDQETIWIKQITLRGFRFSASVASLTDSEQRALFTLFLDWLNKGYLTMPMLSLVKWDAENPDEGMLKAAIAQGNSMDIGQSKTIFVFS